MARLIFCFFAEDTGIFRGDRLFTGTVERMSVKDSENTHDVIGTIFLAMNTRLADREAAKLPTWVSEFPYVNGGLFSGSTESPRFSRIARSYLLHIGNLDWKQINPDIFGSMIQAVADDEERGALGMHYTSVPNILKVLNPLFLDDLREKLAEAGDNPRSLLNLRKRMSRIRILDPACGSGNFLVIAYREMRAIEAEINKRRGEEVDKPTEIRLTNFRGIELRDFPAEIARLALIIAEYQCDVRYRGEKLALAEFLPLAGQNWIACGNALRLDWLSICPPTATGVKYQADDLFNTLLDQPERDFENEGGETYICGNPPYKGSTYQSKDQKSDLKLVFEHRTKNWKSLDYVAGWYAKAADYGVNIKMVAAFVSTNSVCQGQQVPFLWPIIFKAGYEIAFAHTSFKWDNLASNNAGVSVVIVGITKNIKKLRRLFAVGDDGKSLAKDVQCINAYLVAGPNVIVEKAMKPMTSVGLMDFGNKADDGGHLTLSSEQVDAMKLEDSQKTKFVRQFYGSKEFINGITRYCLWINHEDLEEAKNTPALANQIELVKEARLKSKDAYARSLASRPHQFKTPRVADNSVIVTPRVSSEDRAYLPVGLMSNQAIIGDRNFALYDAPLWNMALIASRLHWVWIGTVCVRLEMRFSYSNTLGWNTFPVPCLSEKNIDDLSHCAEDILLARESHFPATIADLYDSETMPEDLREAHERNDEVLERIYIGRLFKNDTERLEKLFDLYTKMTASATTAKKLKTGKKK